MSELELYEDDASKIVRVSFDFGEDGMTRSSIFPDEMVVGSYNIYVYNRGVLVDGAYSDEYGAVSFDLNIGQSYNVYALANVGYVESFLYERDFLDEYAFRVSDIAEMDEFLPLAGCLHDVVVSRSDERFLLRMERLVSKIRFSVDKSALEDLSVSSVRLCQSSLSVRPFESGGSAALSEEDVADGDYCTHGDLLTLNSGGEVCFYALENCQGILLPDNKDPWKKIPMFLEDEADLCTYIEVRCAFAGNGLYDGSVIYRIYLGQDNCRDFNLIRNSVLNVSLCLTIDGLKNGLSWKVTSDYSLRDGYASGWVSRGRHGEDDLYVGEKFEYSLWLSDEMSGHIGDGINECEVYFRSFEGDEDGQIRFSEILESGQGGYYLEATCVRPSEGEICIRSRSGEFLAILSDHVVVNTPYIRMSDRLFDKDDAVMGADDGTISCRINGAAANVYVYLVDSELYNLNVSSGCGYDLSVFDFDMNPDLDAEDVILPALALRTESGVGGDGGPALIYSVRCSNDGSHHGRNVGLLEASHRDGPVSWYMSENACGISEEISVSLKSMPIELTLVDNGWAGYGGSQMAIVVDNPSRLPITVDYWQLVTVNLEHDSILQAEVAGKVERDLNLWEMEYVVNQYNESSLPVYGSSSSFVSEWNSYGDVAVEDNGVLVYELDEVCTDDILAALTYDGWGYDAMSHHIQVGYTDGSSVDEVTVNDRLSDGSSYYVAKYGYDGFNDRGVWLYDMASLVLAPESLFDSYPGLNPVNIKSLQTQTPVVGSMSYDKDASKLYINAYSLGAEGLVLDSMSEAKADGYVRTYPDGTWGKAVDNYCHEELTKICTGFPVTCSGDKIVADNNTVSHVFQQVYENTYFDSWNKIGSANSYWHSAHPTSLSLKMSFKISDNSDNGAYLFTPLFPKYVVYRHVQDGVDYNVPVDFEYSNYKFIEVTKK
jgi:hypothetical protein